VNRHPLTPELIDGIARAVRAGNYWEASAAANGVPQRTFYDWLTAGRAARNEPGPCPTCAADGDDDCRTPTAPASTWHAGRFQNLPDDDLRVRLVAELESAESLNHVALVAAWKQQAQTDWRAAKELLARRHPDQWADRTRHELSGSVNVDVDDLTERISGLIDNEE
jgi:hypothetical protein